MRLLFVALTLLGTVYCQNGQTACTTPSGTNGNCVTIHNCQPLLELANRSNRTVQDVEALKRSACGFQDKVPKVCCPQRCHTPNGETGNCVDLNACPHIVNMLKPPVATENADFVQNSRCGGPTNHSVCCGPPTHEHKPSEQGRCARASGFPPDPRTACCGIEEYQSNIRTAGVGGNSTAIDQYPWLALIEYSKGSQIHLLCGGNLISNRFVLTAAHCLTGRILEKGTPTNVRLGEYDTSNEGPDCVPEAGGGVDCTEPIVVIPIESSLAHQDYDPISKHHDIGIIKLASRAPYTDFIRPICLPLSDITSTSPTPLTLYTAGWGAINATISFKSPVKVEVVVPMVNHQTCREAYKDRSPISDGQICAGERNRDSCVGDSGGPLVYHGRKYHALVGIVSYGPTPCGAHGLPGVYTKIFHYIDWIRSNMLI